MEKLLSMYKSGDIVFPRVVSNNIKINLEDTLKMLDERDDLKKMYLVRCPYCNCIASMQRHYSLDELNETETGCNHCDSVFVVNAEHNIDTMYEKI